MFIKSLKKASFIIMMPFFIFSFNIEINAQVKYVYHNKANLKLNRNYSIPRVAKKSIQTIKPNIIISKSTSYINMSGVKIIDNKDFENKLSNILSKKKIQSKVGTTTISGVEIILGSDNYLANNSLKSKKTQTIIKNKVAKSSTQTRHDNNEPINNNLDNKTLFQDSLFEETTIDKFIESNVERNLEEIVETIEKTTTRETNTEKIIPEITNEIIQEDEEPIENNLSTETIIEDPIETLEGASNEKTTSDEIIYQITNETIQEVEEPIESTEETAEIETTIAKTNENEEVIVNSNVDNVVKETTVEEPTKSTGKNPNSETAISETIENEEVTVNGYENNLAQQTIVKEPKENIINKTAKDNNKFQNYKSRKTNFGFSKFAKLENELAEKAILYYTVRVKSVSNPTDGLKFLSQIKDNDAVWDEHTFHLFKDQENENITNISIGKFVDKQEAEKLKEYLKTKNISNPSIEIHENEIKSIVSNVKPRNITIGSTIIENPETRKKVSSNKNLLEKISSKVDDTENYFSVQVGATNKISSSNIQGLNINKEKLFFVNIEKGKYAMNYGKHVDYASAHKTALKIHKKGLEMAFVTKYKDGVRVKTSKSDYLTDDIPKETISDDINKLGYIALGPNDKGKYIQIGTIYNWDSHNYKSLYDQLERTIYYKIKENNSVIFLVGPLKENEVFIELRSIKQIISDAFVKTI